MSAPFTVFQRSVFLSATPAEVYAFHEDPRNITRISPPSLRVERVITEAGWDEFGLLAFLAHAGFGPSQRLSFQKPVAGAAARGGR